MKFNRNCEKKIQTDETITTSNTKGRPYERVKNAFDRCF